jgi:hypothetical protein
MKDMIREIRGEKTIALITFNDIICDIGLVRYKIEPVGNETGDAIIWRSYNKTDEKIPISEMEEDFNIYRPMSVSVEIQDRCYTFDFETIVKHHSKKGKICDDTYKEYRDEDDDADTGCDVYIFMNTHQVFWKYCDIRTFVKKIERISTNMYWRKKVEGDCPVMMEALKLGECCRLPCNHIISSVAFRKIWSTKNGSSIVCPLCREFLGHEQTIIY